MEQSYRIGRKRGLAAAEAEGDPAYYLRLETGARWLAERSGCAEEKTEHLGHADRYRHLRLDAPAGGR